MKDILFTVVTVCYNSEKEIRNTIESVLNQTYNNIEYIVIDGSSEDDTVNIANEYINAFKRKGYNYIIVSEKDNGIYDAMNKGIYHSHGELISFVNAGDWYEPNMVEIAVKEYEKERYDYFYADINIVKADGTKLVKHSRKDTIITSRHWNHPTSVATKDLYKEIGDFKCVGIHDDFEFFLRVLKNNKKVVIVNVVLANFKAGGVSNTKSIKNCVRRCKDRFKAYFDNGYSRLYIFECIGIELIKGLLL